MLSSETTFLLFSINCILLTRIVKVTSICDSVAIIIDNTDTARNTFLISIKSQNYDLQSSSSSAICFNEKSNLTLTFESFNDDLSIILYPKEITNFVQIVNQIFLLEEFNSRKNVLIRPLRYFVWHPSPTDMLKMEYEKKIKFLQNLGITGHFESEIFLIFDSPQGAMFLEVFAIGTKSNKKLMLRLDKLKNLNFENDSKLQRQMDLKGLIVTASVQGQADSEIETKIIRNALGAPTLDDGIGSDIFKYLNDALHFKSRIEVLNATSWLALLKNGTWTGVGGDLLEDRSDIFLNGITLTVQRSKPFRFLQPFRKESIDAFFLQPPRSSFRNVFTQPFSSKLWIAIGLIVIITPIISSLIFCMKIQILTVESRQPVNSLAWSRFKNIFCEHALWILSCACQQGWKLYSDSAEISQPIGKPIQFSILLTFTITYAMYTVSIFSSLSATVILIKTLTDLLKSEIQLLGDSTSQTTLDLLKNASIYGWPDLDAPYLLANKVKEVKSPNSSINDLFQLHGSRAFVAYAKSFYSTEIMKNKFSEIVLCQDLFTIPMTTPFSAGMIIKRNSPLRKPFNIKMAELFQSGLMKRYRNNFYRKLKPTCAHKNAHVLSVKMLGIPDLFTSFLILIFGLLSSLVFLTIEVCLYRGDDIKKLHGTLIMLI